MLQHAHCENSNNRSHNMITPQPEKDCEMNRLIVEVMVNQRVKTNVVLEGTV